jgi:uncharacterized iron-regulated membrane protein
MRARLRKLHLWMALISSLPLVILSITGALLVFPDPVDKFVSGGTPGPAIVAEGDRLSVGQFVAAIGPKLKADDEVRSLTWPRRPDEPAVIYTRKNKAIFVDPYRGELLGERRLDRSFISIITMIHVDLLAGAIGNRIVGVSTLLLVGLSATGIWLWWPSSGKLKRQHFGLRFKNGWRRAAYDLHRLLGVACFSLLLLISLTGSAWAFPSVFEPLAYWLTWSNPRQEVKPPAASPEAKFLGHGELVEIALRQSPGDELTYLSAAHEPGEPYRAWLAPPGLIETVLWTEVGLDPNTGAVLYVDNRQTASRGDWLIRWLGPLHFGQFGGLATKLLYLPVALSPVALTVSGLAIWLGRRAKQRRAAKSPSPEK